MKKPVGTAEVVLAPGQVSFATRPTRLRTLLGSCVAITFWHPQRLIGGMCHFMLPGRLRHHQPLDGRYADEALELLLRHAEVNGTHARDYQVKLFGGGKMFPEQPRRLPTQKGILRPDGDNYREHKHQALQRRRKKHSVWSFPKSCFRF